MKHLYKVAIESLASCNWAAVKTIRLPFVIYQMFYSSRRIYIYIDWLTSDSLIQIQVRVLKKLSFVRNSFESFKCSVVPFSMKYSLLDGLNLSLLGESGPRFTSMAWRMSLTKTISPNTTCETQNLLHWAFPERATSWPQGNELCAEQF